MNTRKEYLLRERDALQDQVQRYQARIDKVKAFIPPGPHTNAVIFTGKYGEILDVAVRNYVVPSEWRVSGSSTPYTDWELLLDNLVCANWPIEVFQADYMATFRR